MPKPPEDEFLIAGTGITVRFGGSTVLEGVDIAVFSGEIVTLIGPNGAGKTTLVRVLLGLLRPVAGGVRLRPGLAVGYLPQQFEADPVLPLTVRRLVDLSGRRAPKEVARALDEVGAGRLLDHPLEGLSGGELQRVLLARALLRDPDLLVLDEPLRGVDVSGQAELYDLISRIRARRGCGVLTISHDLHLVMAATDRVVCINRHLCCSGRPESVSRHPEYLALFGPRASAALAVYTHAHDHTHDLAGGVVPRPPEGEGAGGSDASGGGGGA